MPERHESASKFLSLVLRHKPGLIGLRLNEGGWASIEDIVRLATVNGQILSREQIIEIVHGSEKERFALSENGESIRANQGHSVEVDLGLEPRKPPDELFHGTATRFLPSIRQQGLISGSRQHVHLSHTREIAASVGSRHGRPIVLSVNAKAMSQAGFPFFASANGVWLCAAVPVTYLVFPADG
jgi:putative RNA 2'-phosphotransferase